MRIALYQPDIPPNVGTILRLGACLNVPVDIIEPCGFPLSDKSLRRAGMDYIDHAEFETHASWGKFQENPARRGRLVLLTTKSTIAYTDFAFNADDTLILGRESAGVPDDVHDAADERIGIPLSSGLRSLNVAIAAAMILGEALRQTDQFPVPQEHP